VSERPPYRAALLALVFFAPLFFAFVLYYGLTWRPAAHVNHGTLIDPARPLPALTLTRVDGQATSALTERWTILYFDDGVCEATCRSALGSTRAVRLALGRDATRVQRVFFYRGRCCSVSLASEQPDLFLASAEGAAGPEVLATLPAEGNAGPAPQIALVDPHGNLLMRYPPDASRLGMLEDLKRLLRLSHIG
jgi:hypothetical protein